MFCDYWDCDVIVKIVENTSDCRSAIYEKLQRIKRRSEGLGAGCVGIISSGCVQICI